MKKIKPILYSFTALLLCLALMPIVSVFAAPAQEFPLLRKSDDDIKPSDPGYYRTLIADAGTEYITYFTQDPSTKLITGTVQIYHAGIDTQEIELTGIGIQISFDDRVAPYSPNVANSHFSGKSVGELDVFTRYVKALIPGIDTFGSFAVQNDANGRFLGGKLSCSSKSENQDDVIVILPGQTLSVAEFYFMPNNGQTLDKDMFKYEFSYVPEAMLRLSAWIGNGTRFLQSSSSNIQSTFTIVKPEAFVLKGPWESNDVVPSVKKVGVNTSPRNDGTNKVGDTIEYTITVSNTGKDGSIWANAVLTDTINQYVNFVNTSVTAPGTWNYDATTRVFTAQLGNIAKGQTVTVKFSVTIASNAQGQNITNYVSVTGKDGTDSNAPNVGTTVKEDGNDRTVYTETPQSTMPTINTVTAGDTIIRGTGVVGASIRVRLPNNSELTATVASGGTWSVNVPSSTSLNSGNTITAWQTQSGMTQSQPVTTTVQVRNTGGGNIGGGGGTMITPSPPPLAGFLADHIPYIFGYPDSSVRPNNPITRAEAASIFWRLLSAVEKEYPMATVFSDVRNGVWYAQSVSYLASINIIQGYPDGTFRPDQPITRAEFAAMASRFDNLASTSSNAFNDINGHWAVSLINSAYAKGWISGYPDGTFRPGQNIVRAEVVTVVNRMLDRRIRLEDIPTGIKIFSDINTTHWAYAAVVEASNDHDFIRGADGFETWRLK